MVGDGKCVGFFFFPIVLSLIKCWELKVDFPDLFLDIS